MALTKIDAMLLQKMFLSGAKSIEAEKEYINELNVFPVPDGDTGTNMTLTIMAAAKEVSQIKTPTMETLAKAISSGSLRGARGNSGVILSQLFRGFTKEIAECKAIDVTVMSNAFAKAVETAYKAVMKPKEGTILTVARGGAEKAAELALETDDMEYFGGEILKYMEEVLEHTPELLPVLKEAGVVDSGGQGLIVILKGAFDAMLGKEVEFAASYDKTASVRMPFSINTKNIETSDIKFGYCTEFIILLEKEYNDKKELEFKNFLESIGDSIVIVSDDEIVKVHVHTNEPGTAIQKALTFGQLSSIKIDNMREEHQEKVIKEADKKNAAKPAVKAMADPRKAVGFIAVSAGCGLNDIFKGLGVDYIIEGGQTMNPSTEDMLNAIEKINADAIFILPNNSNIILAAQQAKKMTEANMLQNKEIIVIPSKTIPQGITALINYMFDKPLSENEQRMTDEMKKVKTGQVTYAIRDTVIDGKEIKQGDIMGLNDKSILTVTSSVFETSSKLLDLMVGENDELVSIYYGEEVSLEEAESFALLISEKYPTIDVEVHSGGQPIYYYIFSVE